VGSNTFVLLLASCVQVREVLLRTWTAVAQDAVPLRTLHSVLINERALLGLAGALGFSGISPALLQSHRSKLVGTLHYCLCYCEARSTMVAEFDNTLECLQCYVNFFCSCGVKIEVGMFNIYMVCYHAASAPLYASGK
jgi:hypothetical protein